MARAFVIASSQDLNVGTNLRTIVGNVATVSVALWFNIVNNTPTQDMFGDADTITGSAITLRSNSTGFFFASITNSAGGGTNSGFSGGISNNVWNHIAMTWDGSTFLAYKNGVEFTGGVAFSGTALYSSVNNLRIGQKGDGTNYFGGTIAEVTVWNATLTAFEIAQLSRISQFVIGGARASQIRPKNIKGYWALDGLQSPEPDYSGQKNNATLTNAPTLGFGPPLAMLTPRWPMGSILTPLVGSPSSLVFSRQTITIPLLMTVPITVTAHG